jgi:hypothetical protein
LRRCWIATSAEEHQRDGTAGNTAPSVHDARHNEVLIPHRSYLDGNSSASLTARKTNRPQIPCRSAAKEQQRRPTLRSDVGKKGAVWASLPFTTVYFGTNKTCFPEYVVVGPR